MLQQIEMLIRPFLVCFLTYYLSEDFRPRTSSVINIIIVFEVEEEFPCMIAGQESRNIETSFVFVFGDANGHLSCHFLVR
jgi:hypothetical protein